MSPTRRFPAQPAAAKQAAQPSKRIVIHIGTHKTGTTTIQNALFAARAALLAQGVIYPRTDRDRKTRLSLTKHGEMSRIARTGSPQDMATERQALIDEFEASGAHTMVLSEEGLSGPSRNVLNFFAPLAAHYRLEVICYLRRQDLFAESFFNQVTKRSERLEDRDIISFVHDPRFLDRLDYPTILRGWRQLPARVVALDFAKEVKSPGLLPSFAHAIGLPDVQLEDGIRNKSPDMRVVMTLVALNQAKLMYDERRVLRAGQLLEEEAGFKPVKYALGAAARRKLLAMVAESNERLAKRYGIHFDMSLPPNEAEAPLLQPDISYLLALLGQISAKRSRSEDNEVFAHPVG